MKATPILLCASLVLAAVPFATLQATPAFRLLTPTSADSNGFINTQIGVSDVANRPSGPILASDGSLVMTNGTGALAGGYGGGAPAVDFTIQEPRWALESSAGGYGGAVDPSSIAQPNGPALPVPEPSSSWLLLSLALIPLLKGRSRKSRAS